MRCIQQKLSENVSVDQITVDLVIIIEIPATIFMMGCLAILSEISGVSSILLIIGTYIVSFNLWFVKGLLIIIILQENHKLITPYLMVQGLCNIFFGFLGIYGKDLTIFIGFSLNLYWYFCVLSMYQKLIEDKRTMKNISLIPEMYYIV